MDIRDKVYAVIDTNVLVSALLSSNSDSSTVRVLKLIYEGPIVPLYNNEIIEEYIDVLNRKKFSFNTKVVQALLDTIQLVGISVGRTIVSGEIFPDPEDQVFYEVRMSMDDSYLVTGNIKHFPKKPFIVTPAKMIAILQEKNII